MGSCDWDVLVQISLLPYPRTTARLHGIPVEIQGHTYYTPMRTPGETQGSHPLATLFSR